MIMQILVKIYLFVLKILSGNEILMSFMGHNCVKNRRKWTFNNPKQDVVITNAPAKFGQNTFIHTLDIERKRNSDIIQGP